MADPLIYANSDEYILVNPNDPKVGHIIYDAPMVDAETKQFIRDPETGKIKVYRMVIWGAKGLTQAQVEALISQNNVTLTTKINSLESTVTNFLDADDTTLDQLSELITEIKANKANIGLLVSGKATKEELQQAVNTINTNLANYMDLASAQTVTGNKTFTGTVEVPTVTSSDNSTKAASTAFVKTALNGITSISSDGLVNKNEAQTITGLKTFNTLPQSSVTPTDSKDLVNKQYVDDNKVSTDDCVKTSGDQTVAGIKTFSSVPVCATNPTANNQLANKSYVDSKVSSSPSKYLGEQIISYLPLSDIKAHLLDGAVLDNTNYSEFVTYVESLYSSNSSLSCFTTESAWQSAVTANGTCSKFVVDTTNHTVRLPKMGSQILTKGTAQSISAKTLSANIGLGTSVSLSGSTGASSVPCVAINYIYNGVFCPKAQGTTGPYSEFNSVILNSAHTHSLSGSLSGSASINQDGLNTIANSLSVSSSHFEDVYYYIVVKN